MVGHNVRKNVMCNLKVVWGDRKDLSSYFSFNVLCRTSSVEDLLSVLLSIGRFDILNN